LRQRRDSTRIIFEILLLSASGASKTGIIRKLGLSSHMAKKYIRFLTQRGHLRLTMSDGALRYMLTTKGEMFLSHLSEIEKELEAFLKITRHFDNPHEISQERTLPGNPLLYSE